MRTTVDIPDEVLQAAKQRAASRGLTLSQVVSEALVVTASEKPQDDVAPFVLSKMEGWLLRPIEDMNRLASLIEEEYDIERFTRLK